MIWNRQVNLEQSKQGTCEPFRSPVGQVIYIFQDQHDLNRLGAVIKLTAAL